MSVARLIGQGVCAPAGLLLNGTAASAGSRSRMNAARQDADLRRSAGGPATFGDRRSVEERAEAVDQTIGAELHVGIHEQLRRRGVSGPERDAIGEHRFITRSGDTVKRERHVPADRRGALSSAFGTGTRRR